MLANLPRWQRCLLLLGPLAILHAALVLMSGPALPTWPVLAKVATCRADMWRQPSPRGRPDQRERHGFPERGHQPIFNSVVLGYADPSRAMPSSARQNEAAWRRSLHPAPLNSALSGATGPPQSAAALCLLHLTGEVPSKDMSSWRVQQLQVTDCKL